MEYIPRSLEPTVHELSGFFKVLLISGARQVGKTTMLRQIAEENRTYVSLDDIDIRAMAQRDPKLFFQIYPPPILIDEVQYAPQLFPYIKILADNTDDPGQIWLTGSQHYAAMRHVQESLAGRVGLLTMLPLSQSELRGMPNPGAPAYTTQAWSERAKTMPPQSAPQVFERIWRGGMPGAQGVGPKARDVFFNSYINTYLLRDVGELGGIRDMQKFRVFLTTLAGLTAQQVNYATLSEVTGVSQPTAKEWLQLLEGLGIVYLLRPFASNMLKRLVRTPKLYFIDTGLASFLAGWPTAQTLQRGPSSGAFLENHVVMEFVKQYEYGSEMADLSYYRNRDGKEIDLVVNEGRVLHPIEIKQNASPDVRETRKFSVLDVPGFERGGGGIVCLGDQVIPVSDLDCIIPASVV